MWSEIPGCKPSTLVDYRSNLRAHLLPAFGDRRLEDITTAEIDRWRGTLTTLSPRSRNKLLVVMHGVLKRAQKVWGLSVNPVAGVEKQRQRSTRGLEVFSPEEVMAPVRGAAGRRRLPDRCLHWLCEGESSSPCAGATSTSPAL
jgi:integrase